MKKIIAAVLSLTLIFGVAAPTYAAATTCKYANETLCGGVAKSLLDSSTEDSDD